MIAAGPSPSSATTIFRAIGPILGYRPVRGSLVGKSNQNNYRFGAVDTAAIIRWIDEHLSVNWAEADPADGAAETALIQLHWPILNTPTTRSRSLSWRLCATNAGGSQGQRIRPNPSEEREETKS